MIIIILCMYITRTNSNNGTLRTVYSKLLPLSVTTIHTYCTYCTCIYVSYLHFTLYVHLSVCSNDRIPPTQYFYYQMLGLSRFLIVRRHGTSGNAKNSKKGYGLLYVRYTVSTYMYIHTIMYSTVTIKRQPYSTFIITSFS